MMLFRPPHHPNADFVEQVKRDGDKNECHQVGWSDDGRHEHDDNQGMLAVAGELRRFEQTHLAEEKGNDRQLEHDTHNQRQRHKR